MVTKIKGHNISSGTIDQYHLSGNAIIPTGFLNLNGIEISSNKGINNGYCGLNISGMVSSNNLPIGTGYNQVLSSYDHRIINSFFSRSCGQWVAYLGSTFASTLGWGATTTVGNSFLADDLLKPHIRYMTNNTASGTTASVWGPLYTKTGFNPDGSIIIKSPTGTNLTRFFCGFSTTSLGQSDSPANCAVFRYSTTANDTTIKLITNDSSNTTIQDSSCPFITGNSYNFRISLSNNSSSFYINDSLVGTINSTLPNPTSILGYGVSNTMVQNTGTRYIDVSKLTVFHN